MNRLTEVWSASLLNI